MSVYKEFYNNEVKWLSSPVKGLKGYPIASFGTQDVVDIVKPLQGVTGNGQFSTRNGKVLLDIIKSKPEATLIVEIGTASAYVNSSTNIFVNNKNKDCCFYTIDIAARNCFPTGDDNNWIITCDSTGDKIKEHLREQRIDILFIDGDHSINKVFAEYEFYLPYMKDDGIIVLHDTTMHPGPLLLMEAIDTNVFKTEIFCSDDYGIGVIRLK
jgi:predicted O-methyltransferase YrrM